MGGDTVVGIAAGGPPGGLLAGGAASGEEGGEEIAWAGILLLVSLKNGEIRLTSFNLIPFPNRREWFFCSAHLLGSGGTTFDLAVRHRGGVLLHRDYAGQSTLVQSVERV
jgi:hypothetical protein